VSIESVYANVCFSKYMQMKYLYCNIATFIYYHGLKPPLRDFPSRGLQFVARSNGVEN